jgi:multidrug resistance efflux pump
MIDELYPDRIDLSPLDPRRDRERWEAMVARIVARSASPRSAWAVLAGWRRPALAAAALVAAVSTGLMWWAGRLAEGTQPAQTVAESLDVPRPVSDWIVEGRDPARGDLYVAVDELP